jgi:acetoacetate decarboxylase
MSFKWSLEKMASLQKIKNGIKFFDAEMLTVYYKTDPQIIKNIIPRPLKPAPEPLIVAFIAFYPKTNFGVSYHESALCALVQDKLGDIGLYILSMPVNDDLAMVSGREFFGYPKKMANFMFKRTGNIVEGWTERKGVKIMEVKGNINGVMTIDDAIRFVNKFGINDFNLITYNFKHFPAPDKDNVFDYYPLLIKEKVIFSYKKIEKVEVELNLRHSEYDPWAELKVVEIIGAYYSVGDNTMLDGKVIAEVKPTTFAPYSFLKWDPF